MDDILVFSPTCDQHTEDVQKVMEAFSKAHPFLNPSKCEFYKSEVSFLGNLVLKDGHTIFPEKLKAICEWGTLCKGTLSPISLGPRPIPSPHQEIPWPQTPFYLPDLAHTVDERFDWHIPTPHTHLSCTLPPQRRP